MDFSSLTGDIRRMRAPQLEKEKNYQAYTCLLNEAKALVNALDQSSDIVTKIAIDQVSKIPSQLEEFEQPLI
jgi:hypothetical protein